MKFILTVLELIVFFFIMLALTGCKSPVVNYNVTTKVNDVWAEQPKQSLEFSASWRR